MVSDGTLTVQAILDGSPAHMSGHVQPGNVLVAIDGMQVANMPLEEVASLVVGESGDKVRLTFKEGPEWNGRKGEWDVELVRAPVHDDSSGAS